MKYFFCFILGLLIPTVYFLGLFQPQSQDAARSVTILDSPETSLKPFVSEKKESLEKVIPTDTKDVSDLENRNPSFKKQTSKVSIDQLFLDSENETLDEEWSIETKDLIEENIYDLN